jgi:hypothetical protein
MDPCNSSSDSEGEVDGFDREHVHNNRSNIPQYWSIYFMDEVSEDVSTWVNVMSAMREFLRTNEECMPRMEEGFVAWFDCEKMKKLRIPLTDPMNDFITLLKERPLEAMNCLALALHQLLSEKSRIPKGSKVYARFFNFPDTTSIRKLKSNFVGK